MIRDQHFETDGSARGVHCMTLDPQSFRKTMSRFASGVTVVTARNATGAPVGLTVSAFASLSLDPPMILVCLNKGCHDLAAFQTGPFAVSVLAEDQEALSRRFAGPRAERFAGLESEAGSNGCPVLPDSLAVVECRTESVFPGGDHDIIIGVVTSLRCHPDKRPLIYFAGGYNRLMDRSSAAG